MKKILILPLLLLSQYFFAQEVEVKLAPITDSKLVLSNKDRYNGLKTTPYAVVAEKTDGTPVTYDLSTFKQLPSEALGKEATVEFLKTLHHSYITATVRPLTATISTLYFAEINRDKKFLATAQKVESHPFYCPKARLAAGPGYNEDVEGIFTNNDRTMVAVLGTKNFLESYKEDEESYVTVFNEDLKQLWSRKISFNTKEGEIYLQKANVTDAGMVIIGSKIIRQGKFDKKTQANFYYKVWIASESDLVSVSLEPGEGIYPMDYMVTELDSNHILVAGLYDTNPNVEWSVMQWKAMGTFAYKVDTKTGKVVTFEKKPFSKEIDERLKKTIVLGNGSYSPKKSMSVSNLEKSNKGEALMMVNAPGVLYYASLASDCKFNNESVVGNKFDPRFSSVGQVVINRGDNLAVIYNNDEPKQSCTVSVVDFSGKEISKKKIEMSITNPQESQWFSINKSAVQILNSENNEPRYCIITIK